MRFFTVYSGESEALLYLIAPESSPPFRKLAKEQGSSIKFGTVPIRPLVPMAPSR